MSERGLRVVVLALTASLFLSLWLWKGRGTPDQGGAAFLRYTSGKVLVRVSGDLPHAGVRQIIDGKSRYDVIKMTLAGERLVFTGPGSADLPARNGDVLHFHLLSAGYYRVGLQAMGAAERVIFGIPLDPDQMSYEDWLSLPGIGPKLAEMIVTDRQKNGKFGSFAALERVPGVGPGRIAALGKYFKK